MVKGNQHIAGQHLFHKFCFFHYWLHLFPYYNSGKNVIKMTNMVVRVYFVLRYLATTFCHFSEGFTGSGTWIIESSGTKILISGQLYNSYGKI